MPLYAGKYAICAFLRNMRNMLRWHDRYKPVSLNKVWVDFQRVLSLTHTLSLIPGRRAGHRPNPFQVAPEASRVGSEGVSWPGVPPGVIVGRTLEHQMLDRLVGAVAVRTDGRVPALDTVEVSCYQWGMTRAYLCHCHALVPGPIPLPTLVTVFAACEYSMDPGMWIAEVPILSDALLMPLEGRGSR